MGESFAALPLHHVSHAPPPHGEDFGSAALRLAGAVGVLFGWAPDVFWGATPAEVLALTSALQGERGAPPPDAGVIARLREAFPDG